VPVPNILLNPEKPFHILHSIGIPSIFSEAGKMDGIGLQTWK